MKSYFPSKSSRTFFSGVSAEKYEYQDVYKNSTKRQSDKSLNVESICFYRQLDIILEALMDGGWVTVDWLKDCGVAEIEDALNSLKRVNPCLIYRAINRTTGRMMDFA